MNRAQIQHIQERINVEPDGFFGPKSIRACQAHLRSLMPAVNPWPKSDQGSLQRFYGSPGDISRHTQIDVSGLGVKYDGKTVNKITCHERVAASLLRILQVLSRTHPHILAQYAGVYNNRLMRSGTMPSMHARAAAIDLAPATNGNRSSWPMGSSMPLEVMEVFAREGWKPAGAFWGRDAMHFEASA